MFGVTVTAGLGLAVLQPPHAQVALLAELPVPVSAVAPVALVEPHDAFARAPAPPPAARTPAPPTPGPPPPAASGGGAPAAHPPPSYPVVYQLDAPSVGVHVDVASVGIDRRGAMEAPEGPLGSVFWREAFWLRFGAVPGKVGTTTIAGHLDDTAGRPAAFWNIRNLNRGDVVDVRRMSDGVVVHYRITEVDTVATPTLNQNSWLGRIYGTGGESAPMLTLITCTGRFVNGEYDHRFIAFGQIIG